jgi:lysozyme
LRGAYHFLSAKHDPLDQAKNFLAKIGTMQPKDMPPCLDIEWDMTTVDGEQSDAWINVSPEEIVDRALKWLNAVETATGRIPIIYTSQAWWKNRVKDDKAALFHRYHIWIADYSEKGLGQEKPSALSGRDWKIWQFTEKGVLAQGIPGHVDANIFKGSMEEFRQTFGVSLTVPGSNVSNVPKTDPVTGANTGTPGGSGGGTGAAPGGTNVPNVKPATQPNGNANSAVSRKSNPFDDVFGNRGGPNIPIE